MGDGMRIIPLISRNLWSCRSEQSALKKDFRCAPRSIRCFGRFWKSTIIRPQSGMKVDLHLICRMRKKHYTWSCVRLKRQVINRKSRLWSHWMLRRVSCMIKREKSMYFRERRRCTDIVWRDRRKRWLITMRSLQENFQLFPLKIRLMKKTGKVGSFWRRDWDWICSLSGMTCLWRMWNGWTPAF